MAFLQDILENEDVKLDNMFIASLVGDIIRVSISWEVCVRACVCVCVRECTACAHKNRQNLQCSVMYYPLCTLYLYLVRGSRLSVFIQLSKILRIVYTTFSSLVFHTILYMQEIYFSIISISQSEPTKRSLLLVLSTKYL
jgi:hypothetical protein